jgi:hypothetical protein
VPDITIGSVRGGVVEQFAPGDRITVTITTGQTVTGGMLVEMLGTGLCQKAGAGSARVLGVALYDADGDSAEQKTVTVATEGVWYLTASGSVDAGTFLTAAANGQAATWSTGAETIIGRALADATTGTLVPVLLKL